MRNLQEQVKKNTYLVNIKTMKKIVQIVAFSENLDFTKAKNQGHWGPGRL